MTVTMPSDNSPTPNERPVRTPHPTSTSVDTIAGVFTVQGGVEQYRTLDHGLTSPRPIVTFTLDGKTTQVAGPEAEMFGRELMIASVVASQMTEEVTDA